MSIIPAEVSGLLGKIAGLAGVLPRLPDIQIRISLPWHPRSEGTKEEGMLKAAPKKKVSHQKRRQKLYAPGKKQLKILHNLNRCPACGHYKRSHFLCMNCVEGIRRLWCERDAEKQPPQFEQKLANPRDEKIIYPGKKITEEERKLAEKEYVRKRPRTLPVNNKS